MSIVRKKRILKISIQIVKVSSYNSSFWSLFYTYDSVRKSKILPWTKINISVHKLGEKATKTFVNSSLNCHLASYLYFV